MITFMRTNTATEKAMNSGKQLLRLLQLNGGTFPTGGFSQSWGLETYVAEGTVRDVGSFGEFLEVYLMSSIGKCEGPIICRAYELMEIMKVLHAAGDKEADDIAIQLRNLEQLSNAVKVTKESREAGLRMGRAFGRVIEPILDEGAMLPLREVFGGMNISYPVLYGCVCSILKLDMEQALAAYVFSTANTLTQSALKLIPLGNVEAQQVLFEMDAYMEEVTRTCMETDVEHVTNFCPGIDIASLRHENLPVRLYMS